MPVQDVRYLLHTRRLVFSGPLLPVLQFAYHHPTQGQEGHVRKAHLSYVRAAQTQTRSKFL